MSAITRCAVLALFLASPLGAQSSSLSGHDCGQDEGVACRRILVTEPTLGFRVSGAADNSWSSNLAASFGTVWPVARRIGVGAVATIGIVEESYLGLGARLRWHATSKVAVDITPTYLLFRGDDENPGRGLFDAAVMYRDRVGLSMQLASSTYYSCDGAESCDMTTKKTSSVLFAGLRLAGKPGRYGIVAEAALVVVAALALVFTCGGDGCS